MTDLLQVLTEMRNGAVIMDCNRKFNELLAAVYETQQKGSLTLKIHVKPAKLAMGGGVLEVETEHDCGINKPELPIGRSLFFVARDGRLTRDDPQQSEMFESEGVQHG